MGTPMAENDTGYKLGQRVRHAKFGEGTIVNLEGSGEHSRLQVAFQGRGLNGWWRPMPTGNGITFRKISLFCNDLLALLMSR
jgi:hypothetical protein